MPKMRRGFGSGAVRVTALSGSFASSARPCAPMRTTAPARPASIRASICGLVSRSAARIDGCARSTTWSFPPESSWSSTPARTKSFVLKLTNFMAGITGSGDAIAVDHAAIDLDAEAGPGRHRDHALDLVDRRDGEVVAERIFLLLEFQHRRHRKQARRLVRNRRQEVDGGGESDRGAPRMRHAFHAMRRGKCGDLLAFGDAARRADVRLYDIHRLAHDGVAKTPAGEFILAARHRHVERPRHLDITVDVLRGDRLLEPLDVEFFQL